VCGGTYSWNDFVRALTSLGHDVRVVQVAPEAFDGLFPGAKVQREMYQYFDAYTYFGPDARNAIAAANAVLPGGFTTFPEWARKNMSRAGEAAAALARSPKKCVGPHAINGSVMSRPSSQKGRGT
jgi:hypothetical protein